MGQTYPIPMDVATIAPANPHHAKPRYDSMTDWHGGNVGNDIDVSDACQAIANFGSAQIDEDYEPRSQEDRAHQLGATPAIDIGKDYGEYAGLNGRTGWIEPHAPYSPMPEPPEEP